jgi:hypothetical protein
MKREGMLMILISDASAVSACVWSKGEESVDGANGLGG